MALNASTTPLISHVSGWTRPSPQSNDSNGEAREDSADDPDLSPQQRIERIERRLARQGEVR